jgi:hypothetical protein
MRRAGLPLVAIAATLVCLGVAAETPLAIHIHSERAMFQVLVSPGKVGTDSFVLQLMSGEGNLLPVKQATLVLTLPERGIEPLARKATLGADRFWHVEDLALAVCRPLAHAHRGRDPPSRRSPWKTISRYRRNNGIISL